MDIEKLILKLHSFERAVLPVLKEETDFQQIVKKSKLQEIEVMRALQWLENRGLYVDINGEETENGITINIIER